MRTTFLLLMVMVIAGGANLSAQTYQAGRNQRSLELNGDQREFFVHLPRGYQSGRRMPLVIFLHGAGGNGSGAYNNSGWKELGDSLGVITAFPSSWRYQVVKEGRTNCETTSQWNSYQLTFCGSADQTPRDDTRFIEMIMDELISHLSVDTTRMYVAGFSNGGNMAGRCGIELSHRLAAAAMHAGSLPADTSLTPLRAIPMCLTVGSKDPRWLEFSGLPALPMDVAALLQAAPAAQSLFNTYINSLGLNNNPQLDSTWRGKLASATYLSATGQNNPQFRVAIIKNLGHQYASARNNQVSTARLQWLWLRQFTK